MSIELTDDGYPYCLECGEGFDTLEDANDHAQSQCCFDGEYAEANPHYGMLTADIHYYQQQAIDRLASADCIIQPGWWFDETLATVPANQIGHLAIGCAAVLSGEALRQALVYGWVR